MAKVITDNHPMRATVSGGLLGVGAIAISPAIGPTEFGPTIVWVPRYDGGSGHGSIPSGMQRAYDTKESAIRAAVDYLSGSSGI